MNLDDWRSRINSIDEETPQPPQPARTRRPPDRRAQEAAGPSVLRPRARVADPRAPRREEQRPARPRRAPRHLARDPLGVARPRASAAGGVPRPAVDVHSPGGAAALRIVGGVPSRAHHRRHLRGGRARPRAVRRGARRELHRGLRQRHPGPAHRHRSPDHRRDHARHRPAPPLARRRIWRRSRWCARTRRASRSAAAGSPRTCPTCPPRR